MVRTGSLVLRVSGAAVTRGGRQIFFDVSFAVAAHDRIGVVGPNGGGKSTLLRLAAGHLAPDRGSVWWPGGHAQVGYLPQGEAPPETLAVEKLRQAGVPPARARRAPTAWSGGQLIRAQLAALLAERHPVLLLDEPTNHLDVGGLEWLEAALAAYPGAVLVASHDRRFLERVATRILAVEAGRVRAYAGGYAAYQQEREREAGRQRLAYEQYLAKRRQLESAIAAERQRAQQGRASRVKTGGDAEKGTKALYATKGQAAAKAAAAMERRLARLKAPAPSTPTPMAWGLPAPGKSARQVMAAEGLGFRYGDGPWLFRGTSFTIGRGDRVGLVGQNGAGKSTLLAVLRGILPPSEGEVRLSPRRFAHLHQAAADRLREGQSLWDTVVPPGATARERAQARQWLGALKFSGDRVHQAVGTLSGGERVRAKLAQLLAASPEVLLLDEPTNHLDADSRQVVEDALAAYGGTLLLASHDRALLDRVATRLLVFSQGHLLPVFSSYAAWQQQKPPTADERLVMEVRLAVLAGELAKVAGVGPAAAVERERLGQEFIALRQSLDRGR